MSYKMPFMLALLKNTNAIGEAEIASVLSDYISFYEDRIAKGLTVDRKTCPYNAETLKDKKMIQQNMITNPFEKFERKRFLYFSKDLGLIAWNHALFEKMSEEDFANVKRQMLEDLEKYYSNLS